MTGQDRMRYRVAVLIDVAGGGVDYRPPVVFDEIAQATHFALRELHEIHRTRSPGRLGTGLYWCEVAAGFLMDDRWLADPAAGDAVDSLYLDNDTGELTWVLDASTRRDESGARGGEEIVHVMLEPADGDLSSADGAGADGRPLVRYLGSYPSRSGTFGLHDLGRVVSFLRRHPEDVAVGDILFLYTSGADTRRVHLDARGLSGDPSFTDFLTRVA